MPTDKMSNDLLAFCPDFSVVIWQQKVNRHRSPITDVAEKVGVVITKVNFMIRTKCQIMLR